MKLFLDTSSVDVVRDHLSTGLIDGVTTNPSLMLKEGKDPHEVIKRMSDLFEDDASISAEVTASVPRYIPKNLVAIAASVSEETIVMISKDEPTRLYIYKFLFQKISRN